MESEAGQRLRLQEKSLKLDSKLFHAQGEKMGSKEEKFNFRRSFIQLFVGTDTDLGIYPRESRYSTIPNRRERPSGGPRKDYQTSRAARPLHGVAYIQWEQMTAKPDNSRRRVAKDLTEHHYHGFFKCLTCRTTHTEIRYDKVSDR